MTMRRDRRQLSEEREEELMLAFIDAYSATKTRLEVDRFLRGLFCARQEPAAG
jgi:hypothetical protein